MAKGLLIGILLGFIFAFAGVYYYFSGGMAPVATNSNPIPFEAKFARMALNKYLDKLPHSEPPIPADEKNLLEGAKVYQDHCAVCHGLPGEPKTSIAEGMFPPPPQLFRGVGVTDDEAWETFWIVSGGIRMTGMPGFKERLGENRMWQVSVLLKNAEKLPGSVKAALAPMASAVPPAPAILPPAGAPAATPGSAPATTPAPAATTPHN